MYFVEFITAIIFWVVGITVGMNAKYVIIVTWCKKHSKKLVSGIIILVTGILFGVFITLILQPSLMSILA